MAIEATGGPGIAAGRILALIFVELVVALTRH